MERQKPKVGDVLYSLNIGNAARFHKDIKLTKVTVTKVGRKYFTCVKDGWNIGTDYYIDGWGEKSDYSASSLLYKSPDEWEQEKESSKICRIVSDTFSYGRNDKVVNLEDLRKIKEILNKYTQDIK